MEYRGTTINLEQELWEQAKIYCIRHNVTLKELINTSLRKYIEVRK